MLQFCSKYDIVFMKGRDSMNELGSLLKRMRIEAKLSLKDVYKATGISDSKLTRIEHGTNASGPSPDTLKLLSKLYNADLVEMYLAAGYLDCADLQSYERTFQGSDLLTDAEKQSIQTQINLFTEGRR